MATITSVFVATPHQPHSRSHRSSLTLPRCISLPENPERHQISLTLRWRRLHPSPPQPTQHSGDGNFGGGSDGGGNFGGSNGGDGSEVDNNGILCVASRDEFIKYLYDLRKIVLVAAEARSLPSVEGQLKYFASTLVTQIAVIALFVSKVDVKKGLFGFLFRDKNSKQAVEA